MEYAVILFAILVAGVLLAVLGVQKGAPEMDQAGATTKEAMSKPAPETIAANTDPRFAAAIILYQTAAFRGDISDELDAALLNGMEALFNVDEDTVATLFGEAWRALGEHNDTGVPLETLVGPIIKTCTDGERREFLALFQKISTHEGAPNPRQTQLFDELRQLLL